jgi:hypothetical protein
LTQRHAGETLSASERREVAMGQRLRWTVGLLGVAVLLLAAGFAWGADWALSLWPVRSGYYRSALASMFVTSILASVAVSLLWVALMDEGRAVAGGSLDLAVMMGGPAAAGLWAVAQGNAGYLPASLAAGVLSVVFLILAARWHPTPYRDARPLPGFVRWAFWAFVAVLAVEGAGLVLGLPNFFPWTLSRGNQVIYGFVFLGAMAFFLYSLRYPAWGTAGTLLAGFLAYDLVLIGPLLGHFDMVSPQRLPSLVIYTLAVLGSGILAAYTLFLHPATRLGSRRGALPA